MSGAASIIVDRAVKDVAKSSSRLAFDTGGCGGLPIWDRYLTVDGKRAYHLGNLCGTCRFLFERMEGANGTVDVGKLTARLEGGVERLDEILVNSLALLMPAGSYYVALIRLYPSTVRLGSSEDYFCAEQVENEGEVDPFWGVPHYPKVPYYRADRRNITFDRGRLGGPVGRLFQFVVPMFPERWLDPARISHYKNMIEAGAMPTAVAISVLDVKGPATRGIDHWCFAHYLLDGHHKVAAAASAGRPLTLITFLSSDRGVASKAEVEAALASLEAAA